MQCFHPPRKLIFAARYKDLLNEHARMRDSFSTGLIALGKTRVDGLRPCRFCTQGAC